jgi:protocatechuate 3,4-dioxygenase beta subunit
MGRTGRRASSTFFVVLWLFPSLGFAQVSGGVVGGVVTAGGQPPRDTRPATGRSVIRGRVLSADSGQPMRRATVRLAAPQVRGARSATTDVEGRYEFRDLPAGRYQVSASKPAYVGWSYGQTQMSGPGKPVVLADNQSADNVDIRLPRGGVIAGRVIDDFGEPVPSTNVMALRQQTSQGQRRFNPVGMSGQTNDIGEYRIFGLAPGTYLVSANAQALMMMNFDGAPAAGERSGFAPTYYPSTGDPNSAQKIALGVSQTVTGIDIPLQITRLATVSGFALDAQGQPMTNGNVNSMRRGGIGLGGFTPGAQLRPDGTFILQNLTPGEYMLRANAFRSVQPGSNPGPPEFSSAVVTVNGEDISGVRLAPMIAATVTGRVVFDDPAAAASVKGPAISVNAQPLGDDRFDGPGNFGQQPTRDDFSFEVKTMPGRIGLRAFVPSATPANPWLLKSVRVRGVDVTDTGFDVGPQGVSGVEIEMTNRGQQVSGKVTDGKGEAVADYTVLVFAQDRAQWTLPMNRFFAIGRPADGGSFKIGSLPPGEYFAVAVDRVDLNDWQDPDTLEGLTRLGTPFALTSGDTRTLDLRLSALQ